MRRLTLTVTPEQAGRTVKSLLRRDLARERYLRWMRA